MGEKWDNYTTIRTIIIFLPGTPAWEPAWILSVRAYIDMQMRNRHLTEKMRRRVSPVIKKID